MAMFGVVNEPRAIVMSRLGSDFVDRWPKSGGGLWSAAVAVAATAKQVVGENSAARRMATLALSAPKPWLGAALAHRVMFSLDLADGRPIDALSEIDEAIQVLDELDLSMFAAEMKVFRCGVLHRLGRTEEAFDLVDRLQRESAAAGSIINRLEAEMTAAHLWMHVDPAHADALLRQAYRTSTELAHPWGTGIICRGFGIVGMLQGDGERAMRQLSRSLDFCVERGLSADVWTTLQFVGIYGRLFGGDADGTGSELIGAAGAAEVAQYVPIDAEGLFGAAAAAAPRPIVVATAVGLARRLLGTPAPG